MQKIVKFNERGLRIGDSHPLAKLTDDEVDLVHSLRESGLSMQCIADKLDVSKGCIWKILNGHRRCQLATRTVSVAV